MKLSKKQRERLIRRLVFTMIFTFTMLSISIVALIKAIDHEPKEDKN